MKTMCLMLAVLMLCGCGPTSPSGGFKVTITGESQATEGFVYPPAESGAAYFVDGWEVKWSEFVVFIDKVTLSENPDRNAADQSQTGPQIAQLDGPWVVNLAEQGALASKEQNGTAHELGVIAKRTDGAEFDATEKYALGYDFAAPSASAKKVGAVSDSTLNAMTTSGYTLLLRGTATFKGTGCRSSNAAYDFNRLPKMVSFELGFKVPVTFKNCVNPELMPTESRGVQGERGKETVAQLTLHSDHPLWDSLEEDAPLRFDLIAARKSVATGAGPASAEVSMADLAGVDFQAGTDAQGMALPYRVCGDDAPLPSGNVSYGTGGVPISPNGAAAGLKDYVDYMTYNVSTMGHLNNDGLCFPQRNYPSPQ